MDVLFWTYWNSKEKALAKRCPVDADAPYSDLVLWLVSQGETCPRVAQTVAEIIRER